MNKDSQNATLSNALGNTDKLRLRILQAKAQLPRQIHYVSIYEHEHGTTLTHKERNAIRQCWNMVVMNEDIVKWFESLAEKLKAA